MSFDNKHGEDGKDISNRFAAEAGNEKDVGSSDANNLIDEDPGFELDELMKQYKPSHIDADDKSEPASDISNMSIDELFNMVLDESMDDITRDEGKADSGDGSYENDVTADGSNQATPDEFFEEDNEHCGK